MYLLKGLLIGIIAAVPVGPLGMLSIRRTIKRGWKDGLTSALGTIASDAVYSTIAVLGMSLADEFIGLHRPVIILFTGMLFCALGIRILLGRKTDGDSPAEDGNIRLTSFASHFVMGLSNPMTFMVFFILFAKMRVDVEGWGYQENTFFVLSIFVGSALLWFMTTNLIERGRNFCSAHHLSLLDKVFGIGLILFGMTSILRG